MKKLLIALTTLLAVQLAGCATTTKTGASGVERKQLLLLPESQVESMSLQSYQQTLKEAGSKKTLNNDPAELARVRTISQRLIAQTGYFRSDAPAWKWEVNVQDSDEVNAYCMPGGKIMVYTGLIKKIKPTDDELAAVIGHEISHALREHGRERMSLAMIQQLGLAGLAAYASTSKSQTAAAAGVEAAAMGTTLFFALPNNRTQEREADRLGLELAARAGYDPNAAVTLWQKMTESGGQTPPEFLSTHPSNANRINDLKALAPKVMPLYEQAKAAHK